LDRYRGQSIGVISKVLRAGRLGKQVLGREMEIVDDGDGGRDGAGGKGDNMDVLEMMMKRM